jgi:1,4-alpha-glucan branching enzyme
MTSEALEQEALDLPQQDIEALVRAHHHDPFSILGPHTDQHGVVIRAYLPHALGVKLIDAESGESLGAMVQATTPGLFQKRLPEPVNYRLCINWGGVYQEVEDPYSFGPLLGDTDLYLFAEGNHRELGRCFGAQVVTHDGIHGVRFAVWAPNARRVSVVGNFNSWDGRRHPMRRRFPSGVWELFIPRLKADEVYKYEILGQHGLLPLKADPMALATEAPPATASVVAEPLAFQWERNGVELAGETNRVLTLPALEYEDAAQFRLRVTAGGCSGFSYRLSIEEDLAGEDNVVEAHGLRMLIDPVTAPIVEGSTLDFNDTMLGGGLKVLNPRAQHECACGESFSI